MRFAKCSTSWPRITGSERLKVTKMLVPSGAEIPDKTPTQPLRRELSSVLKCQEKKTNTRKDGKRNRWERYDTCLQAVASPMPKMQNLPLLLGPGFSVSAGSCASSCFGPGIHCRSTKSCRQTQCIQCKLRRKRCHAFFTCI